ncbi:MAG: Gfo/Idh/MocA family oxidoreductase [Phycisphaerae bacterium]|nr:Gfo/Idh/MocA family oxidoreductase [Phycisphaerae bacterium]
MKQRQGLTRRRFLRATTGAGAVAAWPYVITSNALGNQAAAPANSRINIGVIGAGGMANHHLGWLINERRTKVVAVCDVDKAHQDSTAARVPGGCDKYDHFEDLLARPDVDAILCATPDHWHALVGIAACKAGKDVYCEKPLTLAVSQGRALADAVRRYGRVFQVGSQQRSDERFRHACMLAINGRLGQVRQVQTGLPPGPSGGGWQEGGDPPATLDWDRWLGPAPKVPWAPARCHGNFRWFYDYSGGNMTDWGAHHNDIAQWGLGMSLTGPVHIDGHGTFPTDGLYETATNYEVTYTYANGVKLHCSSSNRGGTRFIGTKGWVHVDRGWIDAEPKALLKEKFGQDDIHLYKSLAHPDNWVAHKINWLNCIESRRKPIADVEIGHRTISMCHLGVISMRIGRPFRWDPDREQIVGDPEANRWVSRPMRTPWRLT